jgi:hypothetical protein
MQGLPGLPFDGLIQVMAEVIDYPDGRIDHVRT